MELTPEQEKERILERWWDGEPVSCVVCNKWIRPSGGIEIDNSGPMHPGCAKVVTESRERGEDPTVNHINEAVGC